MTQQEEIKTIRPRKFEVNLSNADVERLFIKAYSNGITPEELIADYIGDLVNGTYTHGSDERLFANEYFERCCYEFIPKTLLHWALCDFTFAFERLKEAIEQLEDAQADLDMLEAEKDTTDPQEYEREFSFLQDAKQEAQEAIAEIYADYKQYKERAKEAPQELETGLEEIRQYIKRLEAMQEGGAL